MIAVNTILPSLEGFLEYDSGESLLDHDVILFNPEFPYKSRIDFSGGGSCISIEGAEELRGEISHWTNEIQEALRSGKTVFFILNEYQTDSIAMSYTSTGKGRTYNTSSVNNYSVLPVKLGVRNAKGHQLKVVDSNFKGLHEAIKDVAEYRVVFNSAKSPIFATKNNDGILGAVVRVEELPGNLVLLPYFDLSDMYEYSEEKNTDVWTSDAMKISHALVGQLMAIDKQLRSSASTTTAPAWVDSMSQPKQIAEIDAKIKKIDTRLVVLRETRDREKNEKEALLKHSALLYENGTPLEAAIEAGLQLLGYSVENYRDGDVEIDHIIVGSSGVRMIGESEGKDSAAIDITKFRQLESNIGEDLERDEITEPAKGVLFGNGYRLTNPDERPAQFTQKCLTNAKRLRTALVQTADLYQAVIYILDNPEDEKYKAACREAIENTEGEIVQFPRPQRKIEKKVAKTTSSRNRAED